VVGERVVAVQLLLLSSGGRVIPTATTAAPVRDEAGAVLGRVLVLRDVTRETEIERMKTEFLSNVSHELRTPLTPIKGYAEVLARRDVGPDATQRFAAQILESTERLERIVGMIVDFAALDSGRMRPQLAAVHVADVVGETVARWRAREPERTLTRRVARDLPPVLVDGAMLQRCLDELVDNAVKFSPGGEPVRISAVEVEPGPDGIRRVDLSVRDRGVGIETDTASVFGDFFQADASETRHFGGLGLGLALVRRIVDAFGADATVESAPGEGSTFHLLLRAADEADPGQ
jgi:signal transduction histidine kinase